MNEGCVSQIHQLKFLNFLSENPDYISCFRCTALLDFLSRNSEFFEKIFLLKGALFKGSQDPNPLLENIPLMQTLCKNSSFRVMFSESQVLQEEFRSEGVCILFDDARFASAFVNDPLFRRRFCEDLKLRSNPSGGLEVVHSAFSCLSLKTLGPDLVREATLLEEAASHLPPDALESLLNCVVQSKAFRDLFFGNVVIRNIFYSNPQLLRVFSKYKEVQEGVSFGKEDTYDFELLQQEEFLNLFSRRQFPEWFFNSPEFRKMMIEDKEMRIKFVKDTDLQEVFLREKITSSRPENSFVNLFFDDKEKWRKLLLSERELPWTLLFHVLLVQLLNEDKGFRGLFLNYKFIRSVFYRHSELQRSSSLYSTCHPTWRYKAPSPVYWIMDNPSLRSSLCPDLGLIKYWVNWGENYMSFVEKYRFALSIEEKDIQYLQDLKESFMTSILSHIQQR